MRKLIVILTTVLCSLAAGSVLANQEFPQITEDGLQLEKQSSRGVLYAKPGASLEPYTKVMLVDAYVAFKKDWQADYNRSRQGVADTVTDKDMARIKTEISKEFRRVFTETLEAGGYEVVDEAASDVMILRPAIINLEVAAPDPNKPGMSATIVAAAGALTLYVELYDSVTSDKFAQVMERQVAGERGGFGYRATKSTNKQALDMALRNWAGRLVDRLDEAHGKSE